MASKPKKKMGRPAVKLNLEVVEKLGAMQCTYAEASAFMDVPEGTLKARKDFTTTFKRGADKGKCSLRRTQFKHAEKSYAMAIFLGKVYLGQREQDVVDMQNVDQHLKDIAAAIKEKDG